MIDVRPAEADDAGAIASIQISAWRKAYGHIVPARWLANLDDVDRAARWRGRLGAAAPSDAPTFVAVGSGGRVVGFVHTGPVRDGDGHRPDRAEIYTVYVDPGSWRRGVGRALMSAADEFARRREVRELILWVFERNEEARAFYERLGWRADGTTRIDDFGDAQPTEMRYRRALS